jgi:hypothetical protein
MQIAIPADNDGFVFFQCPVCSEFFKIKPEDYEDDGVLEIHCPSCGLCSENYFTQEVLDLAEVMTENFAIELLFSEMKKWERNFNSDGMTFKAGRKPQPKTEKKIQAGIDDLTIARFTCCKRSAKIKTLLKNTGCYCPFCGVKDYEIK